MTMMNSVSRIALALALAFGVAGAGTVLSPATVFAGEKAPTVSPAVGKPLQEAQTLLKAGKAKEAAAAAATAAGLAKTPYETYVANEILGASYIKAQDFPNAVKAFEVSLNSGIMQGPEKVQRLKMLTQVYYQGKNYPKTIELANLYLKEAPTDTEIPVLVAQSYYLTSDYKRAADGLRTIVKSSDSAGRPVKEETLNLLMSAEFQLKNDPGVISTLELLAARYPKPQYMKDLVAMNEKTLRGGTTKTNLDVYLIKFNAGLITTAQDYTGLTELALQDGLPGLAKKVMDKGMADGVLGQGAQKDREARMLTMATTQAAADIKTLAAGEAEAAKAKTGEPLIKQGEAYWSYGQFDKAIAVTEAGIAKGVTDMDDAKLRLGIAQLGAGKRTEALATFKTITPGSVPDKIATLWRLQK